jgi:hypothetical protein
LLSKRSAQRTKGSASRKRQMKQKDLLEDKSGRTRPYKMKQKRLLSKVNTIISNRDIRLPKKVFYAASKQANHQQTNSNQNISSPTRTKQSLDKNILRKHPSGPQIMGEESRAILRKQSSDPQIIEEDAPSSARSSQASLNHDAKKIARLEAGKAATVKKNGGAISRKKRSKLEREVSQQNANRPHSDASQPQNSTNQPNVAR